MSRYVSEVFTETHADGLQKDIIQETIQAFKVGHLIPLHLYYKLTSNDLPAIAWKPKQTVERIPKEDQLEVIDKAMAILTESVGVLLECDTGTGKTFMALWMALGMRKKTIVICPNSKIPLQWAKELITIAPSMASLVCVYDTTSQKHEYLTAPAEAMFLIVRADLLQRINIGLIKAFEIIILDELHMLNNASSISAILRCIGASRIIACTATPAAEDMPMWRLFLGNKSVTLKLDRSFRAVFANINITTDETTYLAERRKRSTRTLAEYSKIETTLSKSEAVAKRIASIVMALTDGTRKILIVSKHIEQCKLVGAYIEAKYNHDMHSKARSVVTYFTGKTTIYDGYSPVLIGTPQKVMTGFDQGNSGIEFDAKFNTVFVCQSIAKLGNIWQTLGRVLRSDDNPTIVWLYHPMDTFKKHLNEAMEYLAARKGKIRTYDKYDTCINIEAQDPLHSHIDAPAKDAYVYKGRFGLCADRLAYSEFCKRARHYLETNDKAVMFARMKKHNIACDCGGKSSTCIGKYLQSFALVV